MSDAYWLGKYLEDGSEAAFRSLVQQHLDLVYATACRRLGNPSLAQEATQNVFLLLARKAASLRGQPDLSGWLYKAALLKAREIAREEARRGQRESQAARMGTTMKEDDSLLRSLVGVLDDALLDLREKDRQALLLRFFEDKSLREVGQALGVGEDAAQKRVAAALESLTRAFRKRGYAAAGVGAAAAALRGAVQAAPSGLLAVVSQTAVTQAAGASLFGLGALLTKLMSLTKTQSALLCLLLGAGPAAWQRHALEQARLQQQALHHTLDAAASDLAQLQSDAGQEQRRLDAARAATARLRSAWSRRRAESAALTAGADAALYRWSEESEYVRVPKTVLSQIALAEEPQTPRDQQSWEDTARPAVRKDGTFSAALVEALDLSTNQVEALRETLAGFSQQFDLTAKKYSVLTNVAPNVLGFYATGGPDGELRTLYTTAFPEEGAQLEAQLRDSLNTLLGPERAGLFWQQARHDLNYRFQRFGKSPKAVTLVRLPTEYPPFYARGQVQDETYLEEESRNAFFHTNLPPAWAGFQPRLLPAEFYGWWPDLSPTQPPPGTPASSHD